MGDRRFPWLPIGAGAATAVALHRMTAHAATRRQTATNSTPRFPSGPWVWPAPVLTIDGARVSPTITDGFGSPRHTLDGRPRPHRGVDILYRVAGRRRAFVPAGTLALAAAAGRVRWAGPDARGLGVTIAHGAGWTTYYTHLAALRVKAGERVTAGQPIGVIGDDPTDPRDPRHLHFELRRGGRAAGAIDPAPLLATWPAIALEPAALRNGNLVYRPVGEPGEPYPSWVRALKGKSGVYVIREDDEVVYVGQSSAGKLYETLTRHFQTWRRWKGYWRGHYGEGHDPGLTYPRASVSVAARVVSDDDALDEEARLIRRLKPRDNVLGQPEDTAPVPF